MNLYEQSSVFQSVLMDALCKEDLIFKFGECWAKVKQVCLRI